MNRRRLFHFSLGAIVTGLLIALVSTALLAPKSAVAARPSKGDPEAFRGREVFDRLLAQAERENWRALPVGERTARIGLALRGTPYVASTLELSEDREILSTDLLGLDCVTFFEASLAFARMLEKGGSTPADLMALVEASRYRSGRLVDYVSRLHYTTDWFYDNQEKGLVSDITRELPGAVRFTRPINFMSTHPQAYRQLKAHPEMVPAIREVEKRINARTMYFVPKEKVAGVESMLRSGDIIAVTTKIDGIDAAHTGMIFVDAEGSARFLHASQTQKKVILDTTISGYLASVSKHTGIMVARPK